MLQCKKIDVSKGIDINETSTSKECMLYHYWYFKDVGFKFEAHVCNKCDFVLVTVYELKDVAGLNVKRVDFRCILWGLVKMKLLTLFKMGIFRDANGWGGQKGPLLKICHTYPAMMKLGTVNAYLKKIQKI